MPDRRGGPDRHGRLRGAVAPLPTALALRRRQVRGRLGGSALPSSATAESGSQAADRNRPPLRTGAARHRTPELKPAKEDRLINLGPDRHAVPCRATRRWARRRDLPCSPGRGDPPAGNLAQPAVRRALSLIGVGDSRQLESARQVQIGRDPLTSATVARRAARC
jgi:hypothetical protein